MVAARVSVPSLAKRRPGGQEPASQAAVLLEPQRLRHAEKVAELGVLLEEDRGGLPRFLLAPPEGIEGDVVVTGPDGVRVPYYVAFVEEVGRGTPQEHVRAYLDRFQPPTWPAEGV